MSHMLSGYLHTLSRNREERLCTSANCNAEQHVGPDIGHLHPKLQRQWSHARNAHLGNVLVMPGSGQKVWWTCNQCPDGQPHEWETTVNSRTRGRNCPFCANRRPCQHNSLAAKAPAIAAQFGTKNQASTHDFTAHSSHKVFWQCELGHEWLAAIRNRTCQKNGCPACHALRRSTSRTQQPFLTNSKHPMMQLWDWELNTQASLDPSKITCGSNKKAHWICSRCPRGHPHRWQAEVYTLFNGSGCPCCSGHKVCTCNSLQSLAPDVAAKWDYTRNRGTPQDYTAFSGFKAYWHSSKPGRSRATIADQNNSRKLQPDE